MRLSISELWSEMIDYKISERFDFGKVFSLSGPLAIGKFANGQLELGDFHKSVYESFPENRSVYNPITFNDR